LGIAALWLAALGWGLHRLEAMAGREIRGEVLDATGGTTTLRRRTVTTA